MKRKALFITLAIVILVAGGVWLFQSIQQKKTTLWDLIGKDASMVIEVTSFNSLQQKLESLPTLKKVVASSWGFNQLLSSQFLNDGKTFLSIHPTSGDDFGFLFYTELNSTSAKLKLATFGKELQNKSSLTKRLYNGIEINELTKQGKPVFSFAEIDDILVMSASSFLLEGALRLRTAKESDLFRNSNTALFKLPTLKADEGNVYLNVFNFTEMANLFVHRDQSKNKLALHGSSLADIKISNDKVLMNGFVVNTEDDLLTLFEDQQPRPIDVASIASNRVAAMAHFAMSDADQWFVNQKEYLRKREVKSTDSLEQELSRLSVQVASIRKSIGNQYANCYLGKEESVVSIIKLTDEKERVTVFDELASKLAEQKKDSLYVEDYAGYQIKLIDYKNFLYQLLYPLAPMSEQSFFVQIGQYLLLSENVELLKYFIDDLDAENTWGKSVEWNKFLATSLQESNINLFFDGKLATVLLRDQFNPKWKLFIDSTSFIGIDKGSAQLSRLESNFYLNVAFQFSEGPSRKANTSLVKVTYDFGNDITLPVKVVKSHVAKEIEIMMADSLNNFYLISKDLKVIWKQPVNSAIVGDVEQVDFFANGKLQYFFTTHNAIHLIDRLGRYVEGYPKEIKTNGIAYSSVVDYDRSKRYRYLLTEAKGNLLLTDKTCSLLEGWNPRTLSGKMIGSARHYRILGKDYFIAINQNGTVNLMNRRGEMARGFPMELGIRPMGQFFITVGNSLSTTYFTVVSSDGLKVQFGLDGQIRRKEVLLKKSGSSQFKLVKSITEDSYVFLRVDPGKIGLIDPDGKSLFEVENPGSSNWQLTYLVNRLKERFYCLYDPQQEFSYYYDSEGRLLLPQPLESTKLPTLYYDEKLKTLSIYNVFESSLSQVSIKK